MLSQTLFCQAQVHIRGRPGESFKLHDDESSKVLKIRESKVFKLSQEESGMVKGGFSLTFNF